LACALFLSGCGTDESANIRTPGLHVTFSLEGDATDTVRCQAVFQVGGGTGTYLSLSSGDSVTCNGAPMAEDSNFIGQITYQTLLPANPGADYQFDFTRSGEGTYKANVVLPTPVVVAQPALNQQIVKGTLLTAAWNPEPARNDDINLTLSWEAGSTSTTTFRSAKRNDTTTLFSGDQTSSTPNIPGPWQGEVTFEVEHGGAMPAGLSGRIHAYQRASVPILLVD
jgi:hypothetical protein